MTLPAAEDSPPDAPAGAEAPAAGATGGATGPATEPAQEPSQSTAALKSEEAAKSSSSAKARSAGPADRAGRTTAIVAAVLALVAAAIAPFQLSLVAETKVKGALVAFFAALSLLLSLRALFLQRKAPFAVVPALFAVVASSLALTAAGFLAFQERGAVMEAREGGRPRADLVAWELGRGQQRSRNLAVSGALAIPGFALGALALGLGIGARRKAGAEIEKEATDPKAAKGKRRKMVAAGWSALLVGAGVFAAGLAVDALAIAAPVDATPHPRVVDIARVREQIDKQNWKDACNGLELILADQTPLDVVEAELPKLIEVAHHCVGDAIEHLPRGMSCATLGTSETTKLVHAEDRVKAACDRALRGD